MANNNIETLGREELRDLLLTLQERINTYLRTGRKNFEIAMKADKEKEGVEKRLQELEDYPSHKPTNMFIKAEGD